MDPVTHFEIPVDEMKRAQRFYEEAFGWTYMAPKEGMEGEYEMAMTSETADDHKPAERGRIDGALFVRDDSCAGPMITVNVENIDEAVQRIAAAGGEIVIAPRDANGLGRYARFRDTEGNVMSLWESART